MKALQITDIHNLEVIDLPMPEPAADEVLLRISYVGFCGSDLNTFRGRNALALKPVIPGHEISAVIERVGEGAADALPDGAFRFDELRQPLQHPALKSRLFGGPQSCARVGGQ